MTNRLDPTGADVRDQQPQGVRSDIQDGDTHGSDCSL
jgi:hypothetical protein